MAKVIGVFFMVLGVVGGIALGVYVAILGIDNMLVGFRAESGGATRVFWGFLQFWFLSWLSGSWAGSLVFGIGVSCFDMEAATPTHSARRASPVGSKAWQAEHEWKLFMNRPDPEDSDGTDD